jgi:hypothetical protein
MTVLSTDSRTQRIVLIDFDWQDTDLLPILLKRPNVAVRLVAGARSDDPGLRVAEICGLPRTMDLADLTREIFDLALVSERSQRRTQIEGLLLALGTPSQSPQGFLQNSPDGASRTPAIEAPLALHAAAFETALGGEDFSAIVEQALPDLSIEDLTNDAPTEPQPVRTNGERTPLVMSLDDFPSAEDRRALENALQGLMADTGASIAELHAGRHDGLECVVRMGPQDALLKGLVDVAREVNTPQVVARLMGPLQGKIWGAWPFRTTQHRGVLAAAAIDSQKGLNPWLNMVEELRTTWDQHDRELAAPAFPLVPEATAGWLEPVEFRGRIELAVERHKRDGLRFAVHRLVFAENPGPLSVLAAQLPSQMRDTDSLCRPVPHEVLMLTAGQGEGFPQVRRRLLALWQKAWREGGGVGPTAPVRDERIEMAPGRDATAFLGTVTRWLTLGEAADA